MTLQRRDRHLIYEVGEEEEYDVTKWVHQQMAVAQRNLPDDLTGRA